MSNQVELETVSREKNVMMLEDLEGLERDPRFQRVILEGYFKDKAVDGVSLLASDYAVKNGLRPKIMEALVAISQLQDYFMTIKDLGQVSEQDLEEIEAYENEG